MRCDASVISGSLGRSGVVDMVFFFFFFCLGGFREEGCRRGEG